MENSYGYERALAAWLIEQNYIVKDVNPALSYAYRKSVPQYKKNDSYDAQCVARVAINELNKLPDAMPEDMYGTLSQLVNRRANFAGIAPVNFSSAGKGDDKPSKQENRRLQGTIYFLAIKMIQLSAKGLPRNPALWLTENRYPAECFDRYYCDAEGVGRLKYKAIFCSKHRGDMLNF